MLTAPTAAPKSSAAEAQLSEDRYLYDLPQDIKVKLEEINKQCTVRILTHRPSMTQSKDWALHLGPQVISALLTTL